MQEFMILMAFMDPKGQDIDGEAANDKSGKVSMNAAGDKLAIGAWQSDGNSGNLYDNRGHVRIYYDSIVQPCFRFLKEIHCFKCFGFKLF